jgi:hypothetical protein
MYSDVIFASDLDNTLIYSYKVKTQGDLCVEEKDGKELSFMSVSAYHLLQEVNRKCLFLPVTTRSMAQYRRIRLLGSGYPAFALVSNGGNLLRYDTVDEEWQRETHALLGGCTSKMRRYSALLQRDGNVHFDIRFVDDMFLFFKSNDVAKSLRWLRGNVDRKLFDVSAVRDKLYILPKVLSKGYALARFCRLFPGRQIICAGDSAIDLSMLLFADCAYVPSRYAASCDTFQYHEGSPTQFGQGVLTKLLQML